MNTRHFLIALAPSAMLLFLLGCHWAMGDGGVSLILADGWWNGMVLAGLAAWICITAGIIRAWRAFRHPFQFTWLSWARSISLIIEGITFAYALHAGIVFPWQMQLFIATAVILATSCLVFDLAWLDRNHRRILMVLLLKEFADEIKDVSHG